jgi:hypothetical protein
MRRVALLLVAIMLVLLIVAGCAEQEVRQRESSGSGMSTELTRDGTIPRTADVRPPASG